jgi:uncharacterized protein YcgL (UPF0745 family)
MNDLGSIKDNKIVFLTGSSRSGTTLISNLLAVHSDIISCPENGFILTHFSKFKAKTSFDKKDMDNFVKHLWIRKRLMKSVWAHDDNKLLDLFASNEEGFNFELACKTVYQSYRPNKQAKLYIDKNPSHLNFLEPLNQAFSQPKFIVIVRDYRDRYLSLINLKKKSKIKLLSLRGNSWKRHQQNALKFQAKNPNQILLLKYENLLANPEQILTEVCEFLDLSFQSTLLEHESFESVDFSQTKTDWGKHFEESHEKSNQAIDPTNIGKYKEALDQKSVSELDYHCGDIGKLFDYQQGNDYLRPPFFSRLKIKMIQRIGFWGHKTQSLFFKLPLSFQAWIINLMHKILYS